MYLIRYVLIFVATLVLTGAFGTQPAFGVVFDFTAIDVPNSTGTDANGNSTHEIVGDFSDQSGTHGFILNNGVFTPIDFPSTLSPTGQVAFTIVNGINANGHLVGTFSDGSNPHAFFLRHGVYTRLDPPGSIRSIGGGLNAQDQVVGAYRDSTKQKRHGFIWSNGVFTTFNVPNDNTPLGTVALGINDRGEIVGDYVDMNRNRHHGFLLSNGVYTTLDVPNASITVAQGINDAGQIAGLYFDAEFNEHGFLLSNGVYAYPIDVNVSNAEGGTTQIFSINAQGAIVGSYQDDMGGATHGFLGVPAD
jgi:uncharacterized membrane protein